MKNSLLPLTGAPAPVTTDVKDSKLMISDISCESWREYVFGGVVYRIENPQSLVTRPGGTTHRVVDDQGIAHCLPAPGFNGCVLRWKSKPGMPAVQF